MQRKLFKRMLAFVVACAMIISLVPMTADAAFVSETHERFKKTTSTIAPGVTQDVCFAYAKADGKQMAYYIATADINRDDVHVYANYKDNQCEVFGLQKLRDQLAAAQAKHSNPADPENYIENYTVVAGVNGDFYNMSTGKPTYAFAMEGKVVNKANGSSFFAIREDGKAVIGFNDADWESLNAESKIMEAVGGNSILVRDGKDVTNYSDTTRHSRTCVGVTADGKVVFMVLDGRQEPFSCGGSMHELAQIMLEAGCVDAINVDGGGSTTFAARQEGEDEITVINRPSDGSERAISSSFMIVSTVAPSNVFERALLEAENEYVTPGSEVAVTATGVSPAGTAADIPENAAWQLKDASMGTVANGVFKSNGTAGDAVVQMVVDGEVVGETTIHVVVPTEIAFKRESRIISYGKTVKFALTATINNGETEVLLKDGDIALSLSDEKLGTVEGTSYTANAESAEVTEGVITAALIHDTSVKDTIKISLTNLPDEAVVIKDFDNVSVTLEGEDEVCLGKDEFKDVTLVNGKKLGMWVNVPDDAENSNIQFKFRNKTDDTLKAEKVLEGAAQRGWQYVETDLTGLNDGNYYLECIDFVNESALDSFTYNVGKLLIEYIEIDDDREEPVFEYVNFLYEEVSDSIPMEGQTIGYDTFSLVVRVHDAGEGIDRNSVKVYVDGVEFTKGVKCDSLGIIVTDDIKLANGTHKITIAVSDKNGNTAYVVREVNINAASDIPAVAVSANAPAQLMNGSVYSLGVEVEDVANLESVSMILNANALSKLELDNIAAAAGFKASYEIDKVTNDAKITIEKVSDTEFVALGEKFLLAEIPVRVNDKLELSLDKGEAVYEDGVISTFSMKKVEAAATAHTHTETALEDEAATCTTDGYTGRTFCSVCNSVVNWGTTQKASGHAYTPTDGKLVCHCGETLTGTGLVKANGSWYYIVNDNLKADWQYIDGEYYYFDTKTYKAYSGNYKFFGRVTYSFEENGKLIAGDWYKTSAGTMYYYGPGYYEKGWKEIDGKQYFFKSGYRYEGLQFVIESNSTIAQWYNFGDDGAVVEKLTRTGLMRVGDELYYLINGESQYGMFKINTYYYYFLSGTRAAIKDGTYNCTNMMQSGLPAGSYTFDSLCRIVRGDEDSRTPSETLKISSASLTLEDNLTINFKVKSKLFTEVGYSEPKIVFECNGVETVVTDYRIVGDSFVFDYENIAPNQMNDTIKATLYTDFCGREYVSKTVEYSVAKYAYNMLGKNADNEEFRALLVDLLEYGTAAQNYAGYNTENPVNANLTAEQKAWATTAEREYTSVLNTAYETVEKANATWKGAGLNLKDRVEIRLKLAASSTNSMRVVAKLADGTEWAIPAEKFENNGDGTYYVYFNGLNSALLSETVYFTVYKGNKPVSNTLTYSVETYVNRNIAGANEDFASLLRNMMDYGDSTYKYVY